MDALYLHLPYCRSVCPYCDFPVERYGDAAAPSVEAYVAALDRELSVRAAGIAPRLIYVGGGTPTELSPQETDAVLAVLARHCDLGAVEEWSVESNPRTLTAEVLARWRAAGATRISVGAQSFDATRLQRLGRAHRADDIGAAAQMVRDAGFADLSLDLIIAVDDESAAQAAADAGAAAACAPDHVSVYTLTIEAGTPFARLARDGRLIPPAPDRQAAQLAAARDRLATAGLYPYEVSNLALPGHACRMHQVYWSGGDYLGVGVGAASHHAGRRMKNTRDTAAYVTAWTAGDGAAAVAETEQLSPERRAAERAFLGLRLPDGFRLGDVTAQTGCDAVRLLGPALLALAAEGVVVWEGDRVRPTRRGVWLADAAARRVFDSIAAAP